MYLAITNLGHYGHMTWYILNILNNIPSQNIVVISVWYILNVLNVCWFGTVLVLWPQTLQCTCNVPGQYITPCPQ